MESGNTMHQVAEGSDVVTEVKKEDRLLAYSISTDTVIEPAQGSCIFKVPTRMRTHVEDIFEPRFMSIGPYHHGNPVLRTVEVQKLQCCRDLLVRMPSLCMEDILYAIKQLEVPARQSYAEAISLSSDEFVEMMVVDGCFILQLLYENNDNPLGKKIINRLRRDLVLLENQLPFIVLEKLFELTKDPDQPVDSLFRLVATFFSPMLPNVQTKSHVKGKHILDILRNLLLPSSELTKVEDDSSWDYPPGATEISLAGVKFKKKIAANGILDITFTDHGVLEIPQLHFGESWSCLFPNLIALEQCRIDYSDQITSYVMLISSFVRSERDVKILQRSGILYGNQEGKVDVDVISFPVGLTGVVADEFYYTGLCNVVNAYCRTRLHGLRATFVREYANNGWAAISVISAFVLLVLTLLQTYFAIYNAWSPSTTRS